MVYLWLRVLLLSHHNFCPGTCVMIFSSASRPNKLVMQGWWGIGVRTDGGNDGGRLSSIFPGVKFIHEVYCLSLHVFLPHAWDIGSANSIQRILSSNFLDIELQKFDSRRISALRRLFTNNNHFFFPADSVQPETSSDFLPSTSVQAFSSEFCSVFFLHANCQDFLHRFLSIIIRIETSPTIVRYYPPFPCLRLISFVA
jgi:hypothetical protein